MIRNLAIDKTHCAVYLVCVENTKILNMKDFPEGVEATHLLTNRLVTRILVVDEAHAIQLKAFLTKKLQPVLEINQDFDTGIWCLDVACLDLSTQESPHIPT